MTPINVFAVSTDESEIFSKDNISLTPYEKTPEEQAIEKILAHKRALGEDTSNATRSQAQGLDDGGV